jgi:hypothetical protein
MNVDGSLVEGPKALCELQGYVYDAWLRMAQIYEALGRTDSAAGGKAAGRDAHRPREESGERRRNRHSSDFCCRRKEN